jgi:hypothetical protein
MIGRTVSLHEVQARWAYSEINSPRFHRLYAQHPRSPVVLPKAKDSVPFGDLSPTDVDVLVELHRGVRGYFLYYLNGDEVFTCEAWSKEQIETVYVSPSNYSLIPLRSFAASPRPLGSDGNPAWDDPRVAADLCPSDRPFDQSEPVVIVLFENRKVLLDGYCRTLIFLKSENTSELLVWFPSAFNRAAEQLLRRGP